MSLRRSVKAKVYYFNYILINVKNHPFIIFVTKIARKRSETDEFEVQQWIEAVIGESFPTNKKYDEALRDGIILCKLMNKLKPGSVPRIKLVGSGFQLRDNLNQFQIAAREYGLPETDLFQSVDLYDRHNIAQVTMTIYALGRHVCIKSVLFL